MSDYSSNFPQQRPTLNLDFANSGKLDSRLSYSRSSTGTAFSAERHLSSLNLTTNSNDLSDWGRIYITRTLSQVGPDGSSNAAKLTGQAGTVFKAIYNTTLANTAAQTISFFAKEDTHRYIQVSVNGDATKFVNFDLNGAGAVSANGTGVTASITASGGGYLRCAVNLTLPSTSAYISLQDSLSATREATTASTGSIYIFGAMATTLGDATNVAAYQPSGSQIHREFAPTLESYSNDQPRFEYAADGQSVGLLIESQSSNLFARSSGFDYTAAWTPTNSAVGAEAISPDGTLNAFAWREDSQSNVRRLFQTATVAAGSVAFSVYAKLLGNERRLVIREDTTTGDSAVFDLSSGTVAATNVGGAGLIEAAGGGWYRCTLITSPGSGSKIFGFWLASGTGTNYESYTGDGYSGVILFGAMCENASAPSSYIESLGTASVTRAADSCSVALSNIGLASGQDLTAVVEGETAEIAGAALIGFDDGSSSNYARILRHSNLNYTFDVRTNAVSQAVITLGSSSSDTKFAFRVENNNIGAAADGSSVTTDTSATIGLMTTMQIGNAYWGVQTNGTISRVSIYSEPLSDTNLTALSS